MSNLEDDRLKIRNKKGRFCKTDHDNRTKDHETDNSTSLGSLDHCYGSIGDEKHVDIVPPSSCYSTEWKSGRRVVELGLLADGLKSCHWCTNPLQLHNTLSSKTEGLVTILNISCAHCGKANSLPTSSKHGKVYDVNTKLAMAMLHSGVGIRQINSILSALNIPAVNHSLIVRRQNEAGQAIESVAQDSADKSLQEETEENANEGQKDEIDVSVDAGWQKRGSGRAYNSLSGHCSMIGAKTGKVLAYAVRSKSCRVCSHHIKEGSKGTCKGHKCRKNWTGSAKSMEPDMVVDMIQQTAKKGVKVTGVVGDDDTTTSAHLKVAVTHRIEKRSDGNHVKKNLANSLYNLQKSYRVLTTRVINYLLKLFNYCVSQHKHDPAGIKRGLEALVQHPYGDHSACSESWCRFIRNPKAKYSALPYGKPLTDKNLKVALANVFGLYQNQAEKLSVLGSTQANESLNKSIASKAPKHLHFSGSGSLTFRVAASVAQKNLGNSYLTKVNHKLGISPGTYTLKLGLLRDLQHRKRKAIAITRKAKQRRLMLKKARQSNEAAQVVREGPTYETNIDITEDVDITTIPPPLTKPGKTQLSTEGRELVYFDLETTGLERTSHITEIAAVHGTDRFSTFVWPKKRVSSKASEVTGVSIVGDSMLCKGKAVDAVPITTALVDFLAFLKKCSEDRSKIILVGHNIASFDCRVLLHAIKSCGKYADLEKVVYGFLDTYTLLKKSFPGLQSYKQEDLVMHFTQQTYMAHSAVEDVMALQQLMSSVQLEQPVLSSSAFSLETAFLSYTYSCNVSNNLTTLQTLIDKKIVSKGIAMKIAGSGLKFCHLCVVYKRNGLEGLHTLLSEVSDGRVRVTKSERIILDISDYLSQC